MWISRNEYENINANNECLLNRYKTQKELADELIKSLDSLYSEIYNLKEQLKQMEVYKQESEEYKQKYVDEVQKRLELVKILENIT